jgi:hypothetical protein
MATWRASCAQLLRRAAASGKATQPRAGPTGPKPSSHEAPALEPPTMPSNQHLLVRQAGGGVPCWMSGPVRRVVSSLNALQGVLLSAFQVRYRNLHR